MTVRFFAVLFFLFCAAGLFLFKLLSPFRSKTLPVSHLVSLFLAASLGAGNSFLFSLSVEKVTSYAGKSVRVVAQVMEVDFVSDYAASYTVRVKQIDGEKTEFPAKLSFEREYTAARDDLLTLSVTFSLPEESADGFPLRNYYASKGIYLVAEVEEGEILFSEGSPGPLSFFRSLSDRLTAKLRFWMKEETGGLASALLLGRREELSDRQKRDFRFLGLSHLLAISGLHLSVLVGGWDFLLRLARLPRRLRFVLDTALIFFFLFLVGFPASLLRAGIMMILYLAAGCFGRRPDSLTSLFVAVSVILLFTPSSATDVGLLLSFSSTLGLVTLGSRLSGAIGRKTREKSLLIRWGGRLLSSICVTLSAVFFTLPVTWLFFGEFSVVSPLSNLFAVPLSAVFLFLSVGVLLLTGGPLFTFFLHAAVAVGNLLLYTVSFFGERVPEPVSLRYGFTPFAFLAAALSLLLLFKIKPRKTRHFLLPLAVWAAVFSVGWASAVLMRGDRAVLLAVNRGKNDYLLIESHGKTLLCDFSDGSYSNLSRAAELCKQELNDSSLDVLLLTHLHNRHIATFRRLSESHRLTLLYLPEPYDEKTEEIAGELIKEAEARGISALLYPSEGPATLSFFSCEITLPGIAFLSRSVQPMVGLLVEAEGQAFGYIGSSAFESEDPAFFVSAVDRATFLWFGIHGPIGKKPLPAFPERVGEEVLLSSEEGRDLLLSANPTLAPDCLQGEGENFRRVVLEKERAGRSFYLPVSTANLLHERKRTALQPLR